MTNSRFTSAQQVFETFPTIRSDMATPPADEPPLGYLGKLVESPSPEDAISFSAYVLDRREAVWWASQCARLMGSPKGREEEIALLTAEAWVRDPEEHRRSAALELGLNGNHDLPGTWVALAAGGSGGTLDIGDTQGPPVPAHMAAKAARSAVLIALSSMPIRERTSYIGRCADLCRKLMTRA